MSTVLQSASLAYQDEASNSDKVYHLQLVQESDKYRVDFQYGRRGSTLQAGTKVVTAILADAQKAYTEVYNEKTGKGYKPAEGMKTAEYTAAARKSETKNSPARIVPQLLNMIEESEVETYLNDDRFGCQEKKDGRHQLIHKAGSLVVVTNKKGEEIGFPQVFADGVAKIGQVVLDGEAIGETFHAFDILELDGMDLRGMGYGERHEYLAGLEESLGDSIVVVPLVTGSKAKKTLYEKLMSSQKEGIVFKKLDAPFKAGRPASGGDFLKFKFYAEVSCRVASGKTGKRSVKLELLNGKGDWEYVGNVTIPANKEIPGAGDIVEIRYLYVVGKHGCLVQPFYKELRDDIDESECTVKQLKYKAEED